MFVETNGLQISIVTHRRMWGDHHRARIVDALIEEFAELTKVLLKERRALSGDCRDPEGVIATTTQRIREEMADVMICLEFLAHLEHIEGEEMRQRVTTVAVSLDLRLSEKLSRRFA